MRRVALGVLSLIAGLGVGAVTAEEQQNLLQDVDFSSFASKESRQWQTTQHTGELSYRFEVDEGQLTIERVGPEPWGLIAQQIDVESVRGKQVIASVELAGEFAAMSSPAFEESGLSMRVQGLVMPGVPAMGLRNLIDEVTEVPYAAGELDWKRYELAAFIPDDARIMEISIRMTYDGQLFARNPSLIVVASEPEKTDGSELSQE